MKKCGLSNLKYFKMIKTNGQYERRCWCVIEYDCFIYKNLTFRSLDKIIVRKKINFLCDIKLQKLIRVI